MSKWFAADRHVPGLGTTNTIQFITNNSSQYTLNIGYNGRCIEESVNKNVCLKTDNHQNWINHIDKLILKLTVVCYAVGYMCHH
jgi:hypothetical protein